MDGCSEFLYKPLHAMRRTTTFAIGLLLYAVALPAHATTITVTNTNDSGTGSLRQALADANDGDTIEFAVTGTITLMSGQLLVDKSLTISGPGANSFTVDGNANSGVFFIDSGTSVAISGLTITHGNAPSYGGGIYNGSATGDSDGCVISANSAQYGGGIYNEPVFGNAALTINNCTISSNVASQEGGGIYEIGIIGTVSVAVNNSTISGNSAFLGEVSATMGPGDTAALVISNSSISGNSADLDRGGGISNQGGNATVEIYNSTFSGNSAGFGGGSIHNSGTAIIDLTDTHSEKTGKAGGNILTVEALSLRTATLSSDDAGGYLTGPGDQINTDPLLGPLQDNGGPIFTHASLPGVRLSTKVTRTLLRHPSSTSVGRDLIA